MTPFRILLLAMTVALAALTLAAVSAEGIDLLTPFLSPIVAMTWQGQFNADFTCYLILSGVWMAWRGGFSAASIALGVFAPPLGILFLAPYLLVLIAREGGDAKRVLLGVHAG